VVGLIISSLTLRSRLSSYDFEARTNEALPRTPEELHGTRCAGQIVSEQNNGVCGVGVAYGAKFSGTQYLVLLIKQLSESSFHLLAMRLKRKPLILHGMSTIYTRLLGVLVVRNSE
jgi:Subtilase family